MERCEHYKTLEDKVDNQIKRHLNYEYSDAVCTSKDREHGTPVEAQSPGPTSDNNNQSQKKKKDRKKDKKNEKKLTLQHSLVKKKNYL